MKNFIRHLIFKTFFLTCYVVDRVKSNSKSSHFKRVFSFSTPCNLLNTIPIFCGEDGIIIDIQRCSCRKMIYNLSIYLKIINLL